LIRDKVIELTGKCGVIPVVLIITHRHGDFDALAASVAASKLYPESKVVMPEPVHNNVRSFINLYRDLLPLSEKVDINKAVDKIIVVDTNNRDRLGRFTVMLEKAQYIKVIDHHTGEQNLGAHDSVIEEVGSTTTLIVEELRKNDIAISDFEATLFLLGIYEDTGCLTYSITNRRDVEAAAYLWKNNIRHKMFQEYLRSPLSDAQKTLLEKLIRNSQLYEFKQRRILISTTILDEYVQGAASIIRLLDEIEEAGLTIVIVQMTGDVYLAARTQDTDLNLLELFAPFSVKGHLGAVSGYFKGVEAYQVKNRIVRFLEYFIPPAITAEQVASKPVLTVSGDATVLEADELLAEHSFKGCLVKEDGKIVGILSRKDLQKGIRNNLGHAPVKGFMKKDIISATPDEPLPAIRRMMVEHNIGRVPLITDDDNLVGIVTRSDILRYMNMLDRSGQLLKKEHQHLNASSPIFDLSATDETKKRKTLLAQINRKMPPHLKKMVLQVSQQARQENEKVYLVGGTIRDLLIDYPPANDLDLVIMGDGIEFAKKLHKLLGGEIRIHHHFGTASLQFENSIRLDMVTARKEFYNSPAAIPQVEKSSLKNDLFRRDFTINTMACSLNVENFGELIDYYNGQQDLENRIIKVLYKLSFVDDPLRILRAVRFEQRYEFSIGSESLDLIEKALEKKVFDKLSRQRLNQEMKLIYEEPDPLKSLQRFSELGLFKYLYPYVNAGKELWVRLERLGETYNWAANKEWHKKPDKELVYLCGMVYDLNSTDRSAIIRKLNLSRDKSTIINQACDEMPLSLKVISESDLTPSTIVGALEKLPLEAILLMHVIAEQKVVREHIKIYIENLRHVNPKINGGDLKKMGVQPGPKYAELINSLKKAMLDGEVRTPQEELDYVYAYLEAEKNREDS